MDSLRDTYVLYVYIQVDYETNCLVITDITNNQSICQYILVHTTHVSYISIVYISTLLQILQQELPNKKKLTKYLKMSVYLR